MISDRGTRPCLIALNVPWMVERAVSGIHVLTTENGHTLTTFNVTLIDGVDPRGSPDSDPARVEVSFADGQWVRTAPSHSDTQGLDRGSFDESMLPLHGVPVDRYLDTLDELWRRSQRCPESHFYEVKDSIWLAETGADRLGCHHYIVEGHDLCVEVLASAWSWKYARP